jgi:hypothetical protein
MLTKEIIEQMASDLDDLSRLAQESSKKKRVAGHQKNRSDNFNLADARLQPQVAETSAKAMIDINKNAFFQSKGEPVPDQFNIQKSAYELRAVVEIVLARKDIQKNPEAVKVCNRILATLHQLAEETLKVKQAASPVSEDKAHSRPRQR